MPVLVCFALKEEAAPFRTAAAERGGVAILVTGIGRRNAEKSLRDFLAGGSIPPGWRVARPDLVFTCGFAGGLNPDLKIGDVIFESPATDIGSREILTVAGAKPAKLFCADRVAVTVAEKKRLRDETGADAVEMESAAIHAVCGEFGIPCATIRVISDPAGEDLPLDFNALARPDRSLDYSKLLRTVARSPGKMAALMALRKSARLAADRLGAVLAKTIFP